MTWGRVQCRRCFGFNAGKPFTKDCTCPEDCGNEVCDPGSKGHPPLTADEIAAKLKGEQ